MANPTTGPATISAVEDATYTFKLSDFTFADTDGDTLASITISSFGANGILRLSGTSITGGTVTLAQIQSGLLTYTDTANRNGSAEATFDFTVTDTGGGTSASATATINVASVNDAPTNSVPTVTKTINEDTAYTFAAADFNSGFVDTSDSNTFSGIKITTLPANGTLLLSGSPVTAGQVVASASIANLTWQPAANANGTGLGSFTYQVMDNGGTANGGIDTAVTPSAFNFTVTAVNDAPVVSVLVPDATATVSKAFSFAIPAGSFTDPEGSALTYSATLDTGAALPSWLTFTPSTQTFTGTPTAFGPVSVKVTANDGSLSTSDIFVINVIPQSAPVVANPIPDQTTAEDAAFTFTFAANAFTDPNSDALTYTAKLANGNALPSWLTFNPTTRTFSGTPVNANVGVLAVVVTASDGGLTVTDTFNITVSNVNDSPNDIALSNTIVAENSAAGTVVGTLSGTDVDAGDALTFTLVSNPDNAFSIVNGQLVLAAGAHLDFETLSSYAVGVRATDKSGATFDEVLTVTVTDVIEPITGGGGSETVRGTASANHIRGLGGDDKLFGNGGNDILDGGRGDDNMRGGAGADTFVFGGKGGTDKVLDFNVHEGDVIDLSGAKGISGFQDLIKHHIVDTRYGLEIHSNDGTVMIIKGLDEGDLVEGMFQF